MEKEKRVIIRDNGDVVVTSDYGVVDNNTPSIPIIGDYAIDAESVLKVMASKEKKAFFRMEDCRSYGYYSRATNTLYTTDESFVDMYKANNALIEYELNSLSKRKLEFETEKAQSMSQMKRIRIAMLVATAANILAAIYNILS